MLPVSEYGLKYAYWGYIFMDRKGNFDLDVKESCIPPIAFLGTIKESMINFIELNYSPRSLLPYQGMISWYNLDDEFCLYSMKTRKGTTFQQMRQLHDEFENFAIDMGVEKATFLVSKKFEDKEISEKVMNRLGWELSEKREGLSPDKYVKSLTKENQ